MLSKCDKKSSLNGSLIDFFQDIKLSHSVFALPFAGVGLILTNLENITPKQIFILVLCMISARSFAMGFNRYLDRKIDKANPRTAVRMIPSGKLSAQKGLFWTVIMALIFVLLTSFLQPLAMYLSLPMLMVLALYTTMKRLTVLTHWYLGFCLGLAPIAVNIALLETVNPAVYFIGIAVMFWTAGFDLLYSLQDRMFDKKHGLFSFPARFGLKASLWASRASFACMILSLVVGGIIADRSQVYFLATFIVALCLIFEHWLLRNIGQSNDFKLINAAFFQVNAWISVFFFLMVCADQWLNT